MTRRVELNKAAKWRSMSLMALARVVEAETTLHITTMVLAGALVVTCLSLVVIAVIFMLRNFLK